MTIFGKVSDQEPHHYALHIHLWISFKAVVGIGGSDSKKAQTKESPKTRSGLKASPEGTVTIRRKRNVRAQTNNPRWALFQIAVP
jgi:hypothetical protein